MMPRVNDGGNPISHEPIPFATTELGGFELPLSGEGLEVSSWPITRFETIHRSTRSTTHLEAGSVSQVIDAFTHHHAQP